MTVLAYIGLAILFALPFVLVSAAKPINYNDPIDDSNVPEEWRDL